MSNPNWFSWFAFPFFAPLSGAVTQDIKTNVRRGVPEIENDVLKKVGLGRQLGIISRAVVELKEELGNAGLKIGAGTAIGKLEQMVKDVEEIKQVHRSAADREANLALDRLKAVNPARYNAFVHARQTSGSPDGDADRHHSDQL